jgi:flagellar biosynthesis GTPase FlhF
MIIKTFMAPDLEKAIWLLGEELGPAAVILRTRFGRTTANPEKPIEYVELTAALDSSLFRIQDRDLSANHADNIPSTINRIKRHKASKRAACNFELPSDSQLVEVVGW